MTWQFDNADDFRIFYEGLESEDYFREEFHIAFICIWDAPEKYHKASMVARIGLPICARYNEVSSLIVRCPYRINKGNGFRFLSFRNLNQVYGIEANWLDYITAAFKRYTVAVQGASDSSNVGIFQVHVFDNHVEYYEWIAKNITKTVTEFLPTQKPKKEQPERNITLGEL